MSQTMWLVALSAVAVVSAVLSFVAWSLLARPPRSPSPAGAESPGEGDGEAVGAAEDDDRAADPGETDGADDEAAEHDEDDPDAG